MFVRELPSPFSWLKKQVSGVVCHAAQDCGQKDCRNRDDGGSGQKEGMLFDTSNLQTVSKMMTSLPDKAQLNSREEMIKVALTYPAGLKIGSFVKADSPMAPDAYRYENGQLMAGPGCTFFQACDNMKTQKIPTLSGLTHRVIAVDEELGVVALRMNFGPGSLFSGNGELDVWHSFKITGGLIHAAEAYCKQMPPATKSGWE